MPDEGDRPLDSAKAKSDALSLAEQAEAEAAEAEALAAAARARARAIQLRREAEAERESEAAAEVDDASDEPEESETVEEPAAAEALETTEPGGRRLPAPKVSLALTVAAVVGIVGLLAAGGWMIYQHHNVLQERQREAAYVATARQGVVNLTSLDFNKAKEGVQRVLDIATGEFKDDFQRRAADFESVVKASKAVTEGTVTVTAVESANRDSAVILVLSNERVTNNAGAKEEPRTFRFRVTVVHEGDDLKVSKVEFVL